MIDTLYNTTDSRLCYRSPKVKVIEVKVQGILCFSGDNSTYSEPEEDQLP